MIATVLLCSGSAGILYSVVSFMPTPHNYWKIFTILTDPNLVCHVRVLPKVVASIRIHYYLYCKCAHIIPLLCNVSQAAAEERTVIEHELIQ